MVSALLYIDHVKCSFTAPRWDASGSDVVRRKRTWVYLLSSAAAYGVYLVIVIGRTRHTPVAQVS